MTTKRYVFTLNDRYPEHQALIEWLEGSQSKSEDIRDALLEWFRGESTREEPEEPPDPMLVALQTIAQELRHNRKVSEEIADSLKNGVVAASPAPATSKPNGKGEQTEQGEDPDDKLVRAMVGISFADAFDN